MKHTLLPRNLARYSVHVVDRALDLLEVLRDAGRPLGLMEITRRVGGTKSSVFRLLCTLERRGYIERPESDGRYGLGPKLLSYHDAGTAHRTLTELALPRMRQLLEAYGETINLGVLRNGEVLYLEMLESPHSFRMAARVGNRSPVHSTALGKAIVAFKPDAEIAEVIRAHGLRALTPRTITSSVAWKRELARTRTRGYAEDNGETELEAYCIGAPIFSAGGEVTGAISISGPASRMRAIKPAASRALVAACRTISRALGYRTQIAHSAGG